MSKLPSAHATCHVAQCHHSLNIALERHDVYIRLCVVLGRKHDRGGGGAVEGAVVYNNDLEGAPFWWL
jgi:hypothetical protein